MGLQYECYAVLKGFVMGLSCQVEVFFKTDKFYNELYLTILLQGEFH